MGLSGLIVSGVGHCTPPPLTPGQVQAIVLDLPTIPDLDALAAKYGVAVDQVRQAIDHASRLSR